MDGYEIPVEILALRERVVLALCSDHGHLDREGSLACRTCNRRADQIMPIAAAAYRAGQQQAAREIAEQIETTEWLNCTAFARKARDYEAMVTS